MSSSKLSWLRPFQAAVRAINMVWVCIVYMPCPDNMCFEFQHPKAIRKYWQLKTYSLWQSWSPSESIQKNTISMAKGLHLSITIPSAGSLWGPIHACLKVLHPPPKMDQSNPVAQSHKVIEQHSQRMNVTWSVKCFQKTRQASSLLMLPSSKAMFLKGWKWLVIDLSIVDQKGLSDYPQEESAGNIVRLRSMHNDKKKSPKHQNINK